MNLTKKQLEQLITKFNRQHIELVKWLYDNHKDILRQYEKEKCGGMRIEFLKDDKTKYR